MYHDGNAASNTSNLPTPRGSTTPVTMATAFCPIEKMPPTSIGAKLMQVSHSQALNLLHKSLSTSGSIIRRPTPIRIVDQPVDKSESSAGQTQNQTVTPVSFASTTQVRMITYRKCKGKDHSTKFCFAPSQEELKCTFCGRTKHSVEMCKAKKKAEKKT